MKGSLRWLLPLCLLAACHSDHQIELANKTGVALTYCPVVTDPPPPHRVVSQRVDQPGVVAQLDPDDFNPVFWDPVSNLGFAVQMSFDVDPHEILVRVAQYAVPPGQEGTDPAMQPTILADHHYEVDPDAGDTVQIKAGQIADQIPIEFTQQP